MLSDVMRAHPRVLSMSEFFALLAPTAFPAEPVDGVELWRILSEPRAKPSTLLRNGIPPGEFLYPIGKGRYTPESGVPAISFITLPHLAGGTGGTGDPDALFDEIGAEVRTWPTAPVQEHYARLFGWLADRLHRDVIVERSGASLRFLDQVVSRFPDANYVHLYRDGVDNALSMSRHPSFRLAIRVIEMMQMLGTDPFDDPSPEHVDRLPEDLRCYLPDRFDPEALMTRPIPRKLFGLVWSQLIVLGAQQLATLPPERLLNLSYDEFLTDPEGRLRALATHAGVEAGSDWLAAASALVRSDRPSPRAGVSEAELAELAEACATGTQALRSLTDRQPAGVG